MYIRPLLAFAIWAVVLTPAAMPQRLAAGPPRRSLITQSINSGQRVTLRGNTRNSANAANDRGRLADSQNLEGLQLQLRRPPELQQALDQFSEDLQNPASPNYHQWLTAAQFGEKFGVAQADVDAISSWLESQGFVVDQVYPNKMTIAFSGTVGQLRQSFHTEIHNLAVNGAAHFANMSDPQVPAALAPAIAGIVSLNDFRPQPMKHARAEYTFTGSRQLEAVVPADIATIYNTNPLLSAGINGQGQTIAVIENTDLYNPADWSTFRNRLGLAGYTSGSLTQVHPGNCRAPGVVAGNDGEAILDAEWASAAAPSAAILVASCRDTRTTFGGLIALQNLLNGSNTPPGLVSISYGECEAENGAAANTAYSNTYQQAVAEGVSIFVSSGDEGAAGCDAGSNVATHGVAVNAFASTPYNVAVGGTDFADTATGTVSDYWNASNTDAFGSAKSYIPEIPWNNSCASSVIVSYLGYPSPVNFCNSSVGASFRNTTAASGGPSQCASGTPTQNGVISGNCGGVPKPWWQAGVFGVPDDQVRDLPDISLFAANGIWNHYLVYCWTNVRAGGTSCAGTPNTWSGAGGTSFSAPIMAGIQALVNQKVGGRAGNPNPGYYALATQQHNVSGDAVCDASNRNIDPRCTIHDVTQGDITVVCNGGVNCFGSSGSSYGYLSYYTGSTVPAFVASPGWDFATGLGSVDAANLAANWPFPAAGQP